MVSRSVNDFIRLNYDQLHIIVPKGTKRYLRRMFSEDMTLNRYINALIELDLRGKTDWGGFDGDFRVLEKISVAEAG